MTTCLIVANLAAALVATLHSDSAKALQTKLTAAARESRIPVAKASLYSREIGQGQPIIVLHGGPDFDHGYLLPTWIDWRMLSGSSTTTSEDVGDPQIKCCQRKSRSHPRSTISTR